MIHCTRMAELKRMQTKNMLRKNLPKALTAVLSPSRSANRAPPGSSSRNGRSHRRRRSECNSHVWSSYPPFFFFDGIGVGTRLGREWVCSLTLTLKLQDISKGPRAHTFPLTIFFFFFFGFFSCAPPAPPQGGEGTASGAQGMSKLSKAQFNQRQG